MGQDMKVVSKSVLDEFLDGFREWRAKKSKAKVDNDPWGPEDRSPHGDNFRYYFHRFTHHFIDIFMAILNGIMHVVLVFLRPLPLIAILFMVYVFFVLGQYKDAQEIEAGAINPQVEQIQYQQTPTISTEMESINEQLDRAKVMIEELEASNLRQEENLKRIVDILKEKHGVIIE